MTDSRLILYGPPLAGESTILQLYANALRLRTEDFAIRPAGQAFDERGYRVIGGPAVLAETIAGAAWSMATWDELLGWQGAVLLVLDPQESRRGINEEFVEHLGTRRERVIGMQITKMDLVGQTVAADVAARACKRFSLNTPINYSTTYDASTVYAFVRDFTQTPDRHPR
jgi:hypothetical protein